MNGPGKYDEACTVARLSTGAGGIVLMVVDGNQGNGFSVQGQPELVFRLPELLEQMAQDIRASLTAGMPES